MNYNSYSKRNNKQNKIYCINNWVIETEKLYRPIKLLIDLIPLKLIIN